MPEICKNCNNTFEGKYCNHCGQSVGTHEINFKFLWHDIQHGLLHFDKGMLYTIPQLYRNPGKTIQQYIEGKRIKHSKPFTLVFLLATIFILEKHLLNIHFDIQLNLNQYNFADWIFNHFSISAIIVLPVVALWSFLMFRKQGKNYIEHLVVNAYATSQSLAFFIVGMPVFKIAQYYKSDDPFVEIGNVVYVLIILWTYMTFFTVYTKRTIFFRTLICMALSVFSLLILLICIGVILYKFKILK
jgi:hypothetical protein